jgi:NADH-quinone oxidoreductase subunit M
MAGLAGFCVKVPTWPFSSWLLKAHVEASTEFSILLSGLLVKFGVIGVLRFSAMGGAGSPSLLLLLASAGLVDALARMPAQYDLKRVVALTTVVEAN